MNLKFKKPTTNHNIKSIGVLVALGYLFVGCAFGSYTDIRYFTYELISPRNAETPFADVSDINSTWNKWMGICSAKRCIINPYTGDSSCTRSAVLYEEYEPFSLSYRGWREVENISWSVKSDYTSSYFTYNEYCMVVLANDTMFLIEQNYTESRCSLKYAHLNENGIIESETGSFPNFAGNFTCYSSSSIYYKTSNDGNAIVFGTYNGLMVFVKDISTGIWKQRGSGFFGYSDDPLFISDSGNTVFNYNYLYEWTNESWISTPLPGYSYYLSLSYVLVNDTMILVSNPTSSMPTCTYAGEVAVYTRSGSLTSWNSEPDYVIKVDPGKTICSSFYLEAKAWIGDGKFLASSDNGYNSIIINLNELSNNVSFQAMDFLPTLVVPGRDTNNPAVLYSTYESLYSYSYKTKMYFPEGVSSSGRNGLVTLLIVIFVGIPVLIVVSCIFKKVIKKACKACKKACKSCKKSSQHHSSPTTTTTYYSNPTITTTITTTPSTIQTISTSTPDSISTTTPTAPRTAIVMDPRLSDALERLKAAIIVSLIGANTNKISFDDAVTLMAIAAMNAIKQCGFQSTDVCSPF